MSHDDFDGHCCLSCQLGEKCESECPANTDEIGAQPEPLIRYENGKLVSSVFPGDKPRLDAPIFPDYIQRTNAGAYLQAALGMTGLPEKIVQPVGAYADTYYPAGLSATPLLNGIVAIARNSDRQNKDDSAKTVVDWLVEGNKNKDPIQVAVVTAIRKMKEFLPGASQFLAMVDAKPLDVSRVQSARETFKYGGLMKTVFHGSEGEESQGSESMVDVTPTAQPEPILGGPVSEGSVFGYVLVSGYQTGGDYL